jgi:ATP-dependent HslUV protease ATP-binding subunit HslU
MTTLLEDLMFDVPEHVPSKKIVINKELVESRLNKIAKDRDLSRYIL